jgi:hypothetical protein
LKRNLKIIFEYLIGLKLEINYKSIPTLKLGSNYHNAIEMGNHTNGYGKGR